MKPRKHHAPLGPSKWIFFLLLGAIAFPPSPQAQTTYTSSIQHHTSIVPSESDHLPIRRWNDRFFVSAIKDSNEWGLCIIDCGNFRQTPSSSGPTLMGQYIKFPYPIGADVNILDIYVDGDSAFFCGYYNSPSGEIGIMGSADLVALTGNCRFLNVTGRVTRIVAYKNNSHLHVVGIGQTIYGSLSKYCIIDAPYFESPTSPFNIAYLISNGFWNCDYLYDISLLDNYVVFVGHNYDLSLFPLGQHVAYYRKAERNDVLTGALINTIHYLQNITHPEINWKITSVAMESDTFALSYINYDYSNLKWYARLRIINSLNNENILSQQTETSDKSDPIMMAYLSKGESPNEAVIETLQPINEENTFIEWKPFLNSGYYSFGLTPSTGVNYQYLSTLTTNSFVASSGPYLYLQIPSDISASNNPLCPSYFKPYIQPIANLNILSVTHNLSVGTGNFTISITGSFDRSINTQNDCFSTK